jgi:hypothetical protein
MSLLYGSSPLLIHSKFDRSVRTYEAKPAGKDIPRNAAQRAYAAGISFGKVTNRKHWIGSFFDIP